MTAGPEWPTRSSPYAKAVTVVSDLLPAAREVAEQLGKRLTRDRLVAALRERGLTVGGERKAAIYAFVRAERKRVAA